MQSSWNKKEERMQSYVIIPLNTNIGPVTVFWGDLIKPVTMTVFSK